jgi:ABC-type lipoprotein export system ATPase subunit
MSLLLEARQLTKAYESRVVLREVSITVQAGERVALTGPSGSGKTTLLNCLGGVDRADAGELLFEGKAMNGMSGNELASLRRQRMGTIFQFFHLLPTLTAAENIEFPLQLNAVPSAERLQRVEKLLERVGLTHRSHALPSQLSGGEMQRVAIARALAHRPSLLLADEPTGNLDTANGEKILTLLQELSEEHGTALVLVTHSLEATRICNRVLHFRDGQIVSES